MQASPTAVPLWYSLGGRKKRREEKKGGEEEKRSEFRVQVFK